MPVRPMLSRVVLVAAVCLPGFLGCSKGNRLETGYEVRPLNASPTEIRGFYAGRFTPEARAAALERDQELERRRPTPGN